ncbi:MAG: winged helix-turn-helix transcriptional regulator [Bdellovibrio sp.]|nr:winged helix-turn-helix transcriptional regulator [Bdellovibrio sp.]
MMKQLEMMKGQCLEVSAILKAMAHPQRLMIMCYLADSEKTVSELVDLCKVSQSQMSQFLNRMHREKLLQVRKEGQFSYYSIAEKKIIKLILSMQKIFCE